MLNMEVFQQNDHTRYLCLDENCEFQRGGANVLRLTIFQHGAFKIEGDPTKSIERDNLFVASKFVARCTSSLSTALSRADRQAS